MTGNPMVTNRTAWFRLNARAERVHFKPSSEAGMLAGRANTPKASRPNAESNGGCGTHAHVI